MIAILLACSAGRDTHTATGGTDDLPTHHSNDSAVCGPIVAPEGDLCWANTDIAGTRIEETCEQDADYPFRCLVDGTIREICPAMLGLEASAACPDIDGFRTRGFTESGRCAAADGRQVTVLTHDPPLSSMPDPFWFSYAGEAVFDDATGSLVWLRAYDTDWEHYDGYPDDYWFCCSNTRTWDAIWGDYVFVDCAWPGSP